MKHVKKAHFLSLALIVGCVLVVRAEYDAQFNARIDEIAGWLPEEPRADGARIADRKSWDCLARSANGSEAVKQAEKVMSEPMPSCTDDEYLEFSRSGSRAKYRSNVSSRLGRFQRLYLAECLENRGRFLSKISEYANAFCGMRSWTFPAHDEDLSSFNGEPHVDLLAGEVALDFAICLDWLRDRLDEGLRTRMRAEVKRRVLRPYIEHARGMRKVPGQWWLRCGNNWNSVCNCNMVRTALAFVGNRRMRAEFVALAEIAARYALNGYSNDGYCSEGIGYWNYGFGHYLEMGLSVRAATGGKIDIFADPKCKAVMRYAYDCQIRQGVSPRFADGIGNPSPAILALGMLVWPDLADSRAKNAPLLPSEPSVFSLRGFGSPQSSSAPALDALPLQTWFADAQVLISRRITKKGGFGIAIKGGHNDELHNHNDVGSYSFVVDGRDACGDPGGEIYTKRTFSKDRYLSKVLNSYGHPVPVVAGALQGTGRAFSAKVISCEMSKERDTVAYDLSGAYDVKSLKTLVRTLTADRGGGTVRISDRVAFTEPSAFEVPLVTFRKWRYDDKKGVVILEGGKGERSLRVRVTASVPLELHAEKIENPGCATPARLAFAFREPVSAAELNMEFSVE